MNLYHKSAHLALIAALFLFFAVGVAYAQGNPFDIRFPIAELGGCNSIDECRTFCDSPANQAPCSEWARKNGFGGGSQNAPQPPQRPPVQAGPGGCTSEAECDAFCRDPGHGVECIEFATANGFITREEADKTLQLMEKQKARSSRPRGPGPRQIGPGKDIGHPGEPKIDEAKAQKLITEKGGPGGCKSFKECDSFCRNPANEAACFAYAEENSLIEASEVQKFKKLMEIEGPGGCRGRQCENYCETPGHEEECLEFARKNDLIKEDEYQKVKRLIKIEGPGGCRGRQCEDYCEAPGHEKECFEFAKREGLIEEKEAAEIERLMNIEGPGGCRGRACETYCNDASHSTECFEFGKKNGLIPPEEVADIEELMRMHQEFQSRKDKQGPMGPPPDGQGFGPGGPGGDSFPGPQGRPHMGPGGFGTGGGQPGEGPGSPQFREFRGMPNFREGEGHPGEGGMMQGEFRLGPEGFEGGFRPEDMQRFEGQVPQGFKTRVPEGFKDFVPKELQGFVDFVQPREGSEVPHPEGEMRGEGGPMMTPREPLEFHTDGFVPPPMPTSETFRMEILPMEGSPMMPTTEQHFESSVSAPAPMPVDTGTTAPPPPPPPAPGPAPEPQPVSLEDFLLDAAAIILGPFLRL